MMHDVFRYEMYFFLFLYYLVCSYQAGPVAVRRTTGNLPSSLSHELRVKTH